MSKVLTGAHAEDVGGYVVEPGQPIPDDADPKVVKRLQADGLLADAPKAPSKSKSQEG
jgi:hypothetical protein